LKRMGYLAIPALRAERPARIARNP
jgi:hypothetical protein